MAVQARTPEPDAGVPARARAAGLVPPALVLGIAMAGCATQGLPDPRSTAKEYALAAERGDADAIYGLLTHESQRALGRKGTHALVLDSKAELLARGKALASAQASVETLAEVRYSDGQRARLRWENRRFAIEAALALPSSARTPSDALSELRQALVRRSYAGLLRVLTSETKSELERDLESLVSGLSNPDSLDVKVAGDRAEVEVPGGHIVKLKREGGLWRVEDFD